MKKSRNQNINLFTYKELTIGYQLLNSEITEKFPEMIA